MHVEEAKTAIEKIKEGESAKEQKATLETEQKAEEIFQPEKPNSINEKEAEIEIPISSTNYLLASLDWSKHLA